MFGSDPLKSMAYFDRVILRCGRVFSDETCLDWIRWKNGNGRISFIFAFDLISGVCMKLIEMICISLLATHLTYWLAHAKKMSPVRAASLVTLVFIGISSLFASALLLPLQTTFYGGAFVGMSEPSRLSEKKVLLASGVFAFIFYGLQQVDFVHFKGGVGGTLGATAFISSLIVFWIQFGISKLKQNTSK